MSVSASIHRPTVACFGQREGTKWIKIEDGENNSLIIFVDNLDQLGWLLGAFQEAVKSFRPTEE